MHGIDDVQRNPGVGAFCVMVRRPDRRLRTLSRQIRRRWIRNRCWRLPEYSRPRRQPDWRRYRTVAAPSLQHGGIGQIVGASAFATPNVGVRPPIPRRCRPMDERRVRGSDSERIGDGDAADDTGAAAEIVDRHGSARHIDVPLRHRRPTLTAFRRCDIEDQGPAVDVQVPVFPEPMFSAALIRLTEGDGVPALSVVVSSAPLVPMPRCRR